MLNSSQLNGGPEEVQANGTKCSRNTLTYLYKHLVDVNGILGTGFYKDGMDGVSIVLGILLWDFPVYEGGMSKLIWRKMQTNSPTSGFN